MSQELYMPSAYQSPLLGTEYFDRQTKCGIDLHIIQGKFVLPKFPNETGSYSLNVISVPELNHYVKAIDQIVRRCYGCQEVRYFDATYIEQMPPAYRMNPSIIFCDPFTIEIINFEKVLNWCKGSLFLCYVERNAEGCAVVQSAMTKFPTLVAFTVPETNFLDGSLRFDFGTEILRVCNSYKHFSNGTSKACELIGGIKFLNEINGDVYFLNLSGDFHSQRPCLRCCASNDTTYKQIVTVVAMACEVVIRILFLRGENRELSLSEVLNDSMYNNCLIQFRRVCEIIPLEKWDDSFGLYDPVRHLTFVQSLLLGISILAVSDGWRAYPATTITADTNGGISIVQGGNRAEFTRQQCWEIMHSIFEFLDDDVDDDTHSRILSNCETSLSNADADSGKPTLQTGHCENSENAAEHAERSLIGIAYETTLCDRNSRFVQPISRIHYRLVPSMHVFGSTETPLYGGCKDSGELNCWLPVFESTKKWNNISEKYLSLCNERTREGEDADHGCRSRREVRAVRAPRARARGPALGRGAGAHRGHRHLPDRSPRPRPGVPGPLAGRARP